MNVLEVTQSILQDMFVMVMLVDITDATDKIADLADAFDVLGKSANLKSMSCTRTSSIPCIRSKAET